MAHTMVQEAGNILRATFRKTMKRPSQALHRHSPEPWSGSKNMSQNTVRCACLAGPSAQTLSGRLPQSDSTVPGQATATEAQGGQACKNAKARSSPAGSDVAACLADIKTACPLDTAQIQGVHEYTPPLDALRDLFALRHHCNIAEPLNHATAKLGV